MNPRKTYLTYLGWCPGVEAASKFIPDKELSHRIVLMRVTGGVLEFLLLGVMLVGVPVPSKPPFIDLMIKTDKENYSVGDAVTVEFRIVNQMPFTLQLEPFGYYETATYDVESGKRLTRMLDDIPPREGEVGLFLWPFSNTLLDPGMTLPGLDRGEYSVTINIDGYEISKIFTIR